MSSKPPRRLARLAGIVAANLLASATTGFAHAGQAPGFAALSVIATAGCWDTWPDDVLGAVRECAHKGVQVMTMAVRPGPDGQPRAATRYEATACTPSANCVSLDDLLDEMPSPKLLLQVSPTLLDAVQADVGRHGAADRVMIEPMLDRPSGNEASAMVAPGLHYSRRRLLSPRPMMVHILQVDLDTPGLRFVVSPGHPGHDAAGKPTEFVARKTTDFVREEKLAAAINATYFLPFDGGHLLDKPYIAVVDQAVTVDGVSMANGRTDSDYRSNDPRSDGSLCIRGHHLTITLKRCPAGTTDAVGAGPVLMLDGRQQKLGGPRLAYFTGNEPRTAIGIDKAGRHLWLVVVDGRQANYSDGMPLSELTAMLRGLGADSAMNMDGGGSSTMVLRRDGQPRIVNSPIHTGIPGRERPVGNQLGISVANSP